VIRESPGKKIRPARRLREMSAGVLQSSRYHIARHQILLDIAKETGETVNYVMPEDRGMSYKDRVETNWAFRVLLPIGSHVPFHCTASGKCFLASLPKQEREKLVYSLSIDKLTANTIPSHEALLKELRQIAKQGYATDNQEFMDDMIAIAVPVCDHKGRFLAAIATHGPSIRLSLEKAIDLKDYMLGAAQRLTNIMADPNI
jgi:DNA-binding IclR family transcriptional regulator